MKTGPFSFDIERCSQNSQGKKSKGTHIDVTEKAKHFPIIPFTHYFSGTINIMHVPIPISIYVYALCTRPVWDPANGKNNCLWQHKQLTTPLIYDRRSAKRQTFYEVAFVLPFIFRGGNDWA